MEERNFIVLGLDFSTIPLVAEICSRYLKNILVIDQSIEPGLYTGTYLSGGFSVEKIYVFFDRSSGDILRELGADVKCLKPKIREAKPGDLFYKASCWMRNLEVWWLPKDLSEICFVENGVGRFVREKILGGCAEYTFYTPRKIDAERRIMVLRNGRIIKYKKIFASYPLTKLLEVVRGIRIDEEISRSISLLRWVGVISINFGVRGVEPEWDMVSHATRASRTHLFIIASRIYRGSAPEGFYTLNLQMSFCDRNPPPPDAISRGAAEARWAKLLESRESIVLERESVISHMIPYGLREEDVKIVREILSENNIHILGIRGLGKSAGVYEQLNMSKDLISSI
ncbi:MAG: hypothetical protein QXJ51_03770 [Sulfolobales archaeon]